jgi:hypothetical protein
MCKSRYREAIPLRVGVTPGVDSQIGSCSLRHEWRCCFGRTAHPILELISCRTTSVRL